MSENDKEYRHAVKDAWTTTDYEIEFKRAMRDCRRTVQERMTPKGGIE